MGVILLVAMGSAGCFVQRKCFGDDDCASGKVCDDHGQCVLQCGSAQECETGFTCLEGRCVPENDTPITCPEEMRAVANTFCMDVWEASRPDATDEDEGSDDSVALSRPGVIPWTAGIYENPLEFNEIAAAGCAAAGKRLCTEAQWTYACKGNGDRGYVYGDTYVPETCSGPDAPGVVDLMPMPTGSFPGCVDEWGILDLSGNVYEHVQGGDGSTVRGGSHKSMDPRLEHRCDFVPVTFMPCFCSQGFRCCLTPPAPDPEAADAATSGDADGDLR